MALALNGSTGISGISGSASTPAIAGSDTDTGLSFGSDTININLGGSTFGIINTSGLNIGANHTSNPFDFLRFGATLHGAADIRPTDESSHKVGLAIFTDGSADTTINPAERARFDSIGALRIGATSASSGETRLSVVNNTEAKVSYFHHNHNSQRSCIDCQNSHAQSNQSAIMIEFRRNDGNSVGGIFASTSNVQYNTASDYRLKENQVAISDGITRLKTLKPYRFNWKDDKDKIVDGFFAHEVTAVPEAVSGTKDGTRTYTNVVLSDQNVVLDENITEAEYTAAQELTPPTYAATSTWKASYTCEDYQGVDQSKLVPLITAALQEAVGKIETLETKVAALEAA
tara:strand:+ start:1458 stop:2492 length:1035 start_codon:yes stop_codon:yes gene_type:complete